MVMAGIEHISPNRNGAFARVSVRRAEVEAASRGGQKNSKIISTPHLPPKAKQLTLRNIPPPHPTFPILLSGSQTILERYESRPTWALHRQKEILFERV